MSSDKKQVAIDYLDEDTPISGQTFCILSFLSPEGIGDCNMRGIKIRGVFSTQESAERKVEELRKTDPYFDMFVAEVGKWCPWDDKDKTYNQEYNNKELNNLMKAYKENKDKSNFLFEQRKKEMISGKYETKRQQKLREKLEQQKSKKGKVVKPVVPGLPEGATIVSEAEMKKEVVEKKGQMKTLTELKKEAEEKQNALNLEQQKLVEERSDIVKKEILVGDMENRLNRVDEVYKKMQGEK